MKSTIGNILKTTNWWGAFSIVLIAIISGLIIYKIYGIHQQSMITAQFDVWFQGDLMRVYESMTDRMGDHHYRVKVHPLYSLLTYPPTFALKLLGVGAYQAVQIVTACMATFWVLTMYLLLRLTGCLRFDAIVFSILGLCSAAGVFWLSVPESYALGSISIIAGLSLAALSNQYKPPAWAYVAVSSFTLSATVTNWMVGILSTIFGNPLRRALFITLITLAVVTLFWGVEKYIFPGAVFFIGDKEEARYLFFPDAGRLISVFAAFVFHTVLLPAVYVASDNGSGWPLLSVQASTPGSAGLLSAVGVTIWAVLLSLGVWALFTLKGFFNLRMVLGLSLIGQFTLHLLYGEETFLYSLHFLPLLLALAALATLTNFRVLVVSLVVILIPIVTANNWTRFKEVNAIAISPRHEVKNKMRMRPQDPWPRGQGHVLLATPGSVEEEKAYFEPGGSFSPGVGTFGVSVWLSDPDGKLVTTSDTIDLKEIEQSFDWSDGQRLPQLRTDTKYYNAIWKSNGWKSWQFTLKLPANAPLTPSLLIRSVGPAGGAIRDLNWDGKALLINKRWSLLIQPAPKAVHLGEEGSSVWKGVNGGQPNISSQPGWAFANIELDNTIEYTVNILDIQPGGEPDFDTTPIRTDLKVDLPDERFFQSLDAQIAHLMMGLVGKETRPGDPTNYPLAWQRDGAYVLVALARAGKLETAKMLSKDFAERDFFGGFGPEADAPGLAIWSLGTVANILHQDDFDRWLWPNIYRKALFIEKMLTTRTPIHREIVGPIVPKQTNDPDNTLVAEPAREGLIIGRMDNHRPLLFINAVSYRGLLEASEIAVRLGHFDEAMRWTATANKIKAAWERAFKPPSSNNDRTYISALWPSWVAADKRNNLQDLLNDRWALRHDAADIYRKLPLWTYFELAEAHQWLYLGRYDRVWATIKWFWDHQSSPGLYTWWEGKGEENSFGRWENVRGWINPPNVTPHYWTAAEMALLQMDMLGFIDEGAREHTLVIGGGIPKEWLSHKMRVQGLRVGSYVLDWYWDGNKMVALIHGTKTIKVKLGNAFSANTMLEVKYQE